MLAKATEVVMSLQAMSRHARSTSAGSVRWSGCRSRGAQLSSPFNASAGDMTAMPISRYETTYPNSAGQPCNSHSDLSYLCLPGIHHRWTPLLSIPEYIRFSQVMCPVTCALKCWSKRGIATAC